MKRVVKPFIIYKSSAGSGKTYTLTKEYLKLALRYPDAFKSILAVTFTNKATQEMKERILKELKRLSKEVNPSESMDLELMEALGLDEEALRRQAKQTLTMILHDYSRFSVSTIDSFFQKVVRAFAREMDLNAKFEVELDQEAVLDRVVDRVVEKVMDDAELHRWLVDYATEEIQRGNSWDIRRKIKELGKELFQEDFKKYAQEIRAFLGEKDKMKQLHGLGVKRRQAIIKLAKEMKNEANRIRIANGLEWQDFKGGSRSFAQKFDKLGDKEDPIPELSPSQEALADNGEDWASKTSKRADAIQAAYHEGLGNILGQFPLLLVQWKTVQAISRNLFVYGIFRNLLEELTLLKDEENILLISDANEFLKEITKENDAPFIYEKVGNQYKNYLIDEFQDTSGFQWSSFKPLLENSLSQGHTNLLVGDVKQSIYRWRGGEMRLLLEEVERQLGGEYVDNRNLGINYRSLPHVVSFNNALFRKLPIAFTNALTGKNEAVISGVLEKAYQDVNQEISPSKRKSVFKGKIRLEFLEEKEEEEKIKFAEQALEKIPEMVMELQERGYLLRDIAFLVRTKTEGEAIADCLMDFAASNPDLPYGFDVLSDESMYLQKSASVKALVAGLQYLHRPDDIVAFKTMWYYRSLLKEEVVDHALFALDQVPDHLQEQAHAFQAMEKQLLQLPLIETLEELIGLLDLQSEGLERAYLSGFKEAIYDYTKNNRADLAGFLEWWEANQGKRTVKVPESHNAMRIMTIHKSKGLQFKAVIMPFLDWKIFDTSKRNVVWSPFEDSESGLAAVIPLSLNKDLSKSDFVDIYAAEEVLAYLDALNLVYVALTRAEEVFWSLSPYTVKETEGSKNQLAFQLQTVLSNGLGEEAGNDLSAVYDPEQKVFDLGSWKGKVSASVDKPKPIPLRWAYQNWSKLLQVRKYAVDFSEEGLEQRRKRDFGILVHELLEKSKNKEDVRQYLEAFYFEGRLDKKEMEEVQEQLDGLFANPLFASWFDGEGQLLAEQGILLPGGLQKRPDRAILSDREAVVVDFKTGGGNEKYGKQVLEYMDLVGRLSGKPVRGYLCYLETGRIEEVVLD